MSIYSNDKCLQSFLAVSIAMFYGDGNYISALDYPLLIFYGVSGLAYIGYGIVWLLFLACNWRDLLRVQFWIGGVILLGKFDVLYYLCMIRASGGITGHLKKNWYLHLFQKNTP